MQQFQVLISLTLTIVWAGSQNQTASWFISKNH